MEATIWPLYGLRLTTPRLELRLPDVHTLTAMAELAAGKVHDESEMPFSVPWTAASPEGRRRGCFQHVLGTLADWREDAWTLSTAVVHDGTVIGRCDLSADAFAVVREARTGSWLGMAHQGQGFGTEMRAALLYLAFAGLGAHSATSAAMADNARSRRVSEKLGYRPDGLTVEAVQGRRRPLHRFRLDRADWDKHRTVPVEMTGLDAASLALFGLGGPGRPPTDAPR
ncbi:GNAT family N-acetyltransferase [Streptomyces tubbatahanensis]|uniref:GNAT family N-acetyltransferase n=1 Tax=Streptomyces tubbatahanensis TaxID=2923272 RepID=A0ABY3XTE3_9ACTN|nr:GNAT family protein [Streptomyces tubbatahanensis]UNS97640.1 GNAT family N-acetyltransferase [Streptomyces tubbatahanensis]